MDKIALLALAVTIAACSPTPQAAVPVAVPLPTCAVPLVTLTSAPLPVVTTIRPSPPPPVVQPPASLDRFPDRRADEALDRLAELVTMRRMTSGRVITLASDDLFEPGSCTLGADASDGLSDICAALSEQGDRTVRVEAFTDSLDPPHKDEAISRCRAEAIRSYLATHGIDPAKITAIGRGAAAPIADNGTALGRAQNRRIEIAILGHADRSEPGRSPRGGRLP